MASRLNKIDSREQLKDYCLRQLGFPVINIEVSEEQIDDCIDDGLEFFEEYVFDGSLRALIKKEITQQHKDFMKTNKVLSSEGGDFFEQRNYFQLPENVISVHKAYPVGLFSTNNPLSVSYQIQLEMIYNLKDGGLLNFYMANEYVNFLRFLTSGNILPINYQRINNRVYVDLTNSKLKNSHFILFDCYVTAEPENPSRYWGHLFLRKYCTLLIKLAWGRNLIKYDGIQLPGGITLNGQKMYDEATREIKELTDDINNSWQHLPLDRIG